MPNFAYRARDNAGKLVKGTLQASGRQELIDKLHTMGYVTTYVNEVLFDFKAVSILDKFKGIGAADMIVFYFQLANLVNAGLPILSSLEAIAKQMENRRLKDASRAVARGIEAGENFSQALSRYPRIFPRLFVSMVKVGEASGSLNMVLKRFAEFFERQEELRQRIKGALFYPALLLLASIAVVLFVVSFIIPQFATIFLKAGIKLPLPTVILYRSGLVIKSFWLLIGIFIAVLIVGENYFIRTERGRLQFDRLKLRLPLCGPLHCKAVVARVTRTLGTLLACGVPVLEALDITQEVAGNEVFARLIAEVRKSTERGEKISTALMVSEAFPADAVEMISVGEESGDLQAMLGKIADLYDLSLGYAIKKITTLIEPLLLLVMGGIVSLIMASLLLPVFDMIKVLRH